MKEWVDYLSAEVLDQILENAFQWFVVVDREAKILYINEDYCHFLQVKRKDAIGKHVANVIENTEMHLVMEKGEADIAAPHFIKGTYMLANRVPLIVKGEIVGAFGSVVFRDMSDWKKLSTHVKTTMEQIEWQVAEQQSRLASLADIIGESVGIRKVKETIRMVGPTKLPVVIEGETGTGKEMFAESLHQLSDRLDKPLVKINCAVIPSELMDGELFGTGEMNGKIQQAQGGTLYVEEVHALPTHLQAKLLRFLQEQSTPPIQVNEDVRFIFSSNKNLMELVEKGDFREDLFYRIQSVYLKVPPLRERMEDFTLLVHEFLLQMGTQEGKRTIKVEPKAMQRLSSYHWPGNVRELQNTLRAMVHMSETSKLTTSSIPTHIQPDSRGARAMRGTLDDILKHTERQVLENALATFQEKSDAAKHLGISRSTFYEKLKKYNL